MSKREPVFTGPQAARIATAFLFGGHGMGFLLVNAIEREPSWLLWAALPCMLMFGALFFPLVHRHE